MGKCSTQYLHPMHAQVVSKPSQVKYISTSEPTKQAVDHHNIYIQGHFTVLHSLIFTKI
jgi:hypothetical protein